MRTEFEIRRSHRHLLLAVGFAALVAGCSGETTRFQDDPFGNPFQAGSGGSTATANTSSMAQRGAVESQPLNSPGYASAPATVPASPSPVYASRQASYSPPVTGSAMPQNQTGWGWDGGTAITVQPGDSIDLIARRHGVPSQAIMQANNLHDQYVTPGMRLVIPSYRSGGAPAQQTVHSTLPRANSSYTPRPVAQAPRPAPVRTSAPAPAPVRPAAASPAPARDGQVHVVNAGDTLYSLGRRYGMTHREIAYANNIGEQSQLSIGQRLTIPGATGSTSLAAAPRSPFSAPPSYQPNQSRAPERPQVANAPQPQKVAAVSPAEPDPAPKQSSLGSTPQFRWPVRGRVISAFGPKANGQHNDGINLAVPEGTEVKAAEDGVVAYAGNELKGYGNLVLVRHTDGWMTAYAHNSQLMVKRGDNIRRGQTIARAGQTGGVSSPQLHFEIRKGSSPVDPTQFLASL